MDSIELTIRHDDHAWVLRYGDVTAIDERECRRETGFTVSEIMGFVADTKPGLDTLAALEWLARRQAADIVSYETVAGSMTNASAITVEWTVPESGPDPE